MQVRGWFFFVLVFSLSVLLNEDAYARPQIHIIDGSLAPQLLTIVGRRQLPTLVSIRLKNSNNELLSSSKTRQKTRQKVYPLSISEPGIYSLRVVFRAKSGRKTSRRAQMISLNSSGFLPRNPESKWIIKNPLCPQHTVDAVFQLINQTRSDAGIPILVQNVHLMEAARVHSDRMALSQRLSHDGWFEEIIQSGFVGTSFGQNIAAREQNAEALVSAWLGSPLHRGEILKSTLENTGLGCVIDTRGYYWWTQNFGS